MSHNREYHFLLVLVVVVALGGLYFNGAFSSGDSVVSDISFADDVTGFAVAPPPLFGEGAQALAASLGETREAMQTRLFKGGDKRALDAACKTNNECESSFCSPRGTCGIKFVGEACTKDEQCLTLYCAGQKCTQPKNVGEKCSRPVECKNGLCSDGTCLSPSEMARREAAAKPKLKRGDACKVDAECASNQCDRDKDNKKRCLGDKKAGDSCSSGWDCQRGLICEAVSLKCMVRPARPAAPAPRVEQKQPPAAQTLLTVPPNERAKWPNGIRCVGTGVSSAPAFAGMYTKGIFTYAGNDAFAAPMGTTGKVYLFNAKTNRFDTVDVKYESRQPVPGRKLPPNWWGSQQGTSGNVEVYGVSKGQSGLRVVVSGVAQSGDMFSATGCKVCKNKAGPDDCFAAEPAPRPAHSGKKKKSVAPARGDIGNLRPAKTTYTAGLDCTGAPRGIPATRLIFVHDTKGEVSGAKGFVHVFKDGSTKLPALSKSLTYTTSGLPEWRGGGCSFFTARTGVNIACPNDNLAGNGPVQIIFQGCRACKNKEGSDDCYKDITK